MGHPTDGKCPIAQSFAARLSTLLGRGASLSFYLCGVGASELAKNPGPDLSCYRFAGGRQEEGSTSTTVPEEPGRVQDAIVPCSVQVVPGPFADEAVGRRGVGVEAVRGHEQEGGRGGGPTKLLQKSGEQNRIRNLILDLPNLHRRT